MMRIITGSARGTRLETPEGTETRPTAERVKEAVFSMIQFDLEGRRVLDLFGGSGQLGLEALSRGAAVCTFVDQSRQASEVIKRNAQKTHLFDRCRILNTDWSAYVRGLRGKERFDIVFLDPPYAAGLVQPVLKRLIEANALADGAVIVTEHGDDTAPEFPGLAVRRHARYSHVYVTVYDKLPQEEITASVPSAEPAEAAEQE